MRSVSELAIRIPEAAAAHTSMKKEIAAVVFFLKRLVEKGEKLDSQELDTFIERLAVALQEKFRSHWYPDNPGKGQAFRCIRVNRLQRQDPELLRACRESGVQYNDLALPRELTLWVDPGEVCCRYGEQNPCFSVARISGDENGREVTKAVTSALERVTSDYHSGSSSDEDGTPRESPPLPPLAAPPSRYTRQVMNPDAPTWNPKKKDLPRNGPSLPHPPYGFSSRGRVTHSLMPNVWIPPGYRGGPGYHNLTHYS